MVTNWPNAFAAAIALFNDEQVARATPSFVITLYIALLYGIELFLVNQILVVLGSATRRDVLLFVQIIACDFACFDLHQGCDRGSMASGH